jgi:hypothetical protein
MGPSQTLAGGKKLRIEPTIDKIIPKHSSGSAVAKV